MTLKHGSELMGTLHFELFEHDVPKTVHNFSTLLRNQKVGDGYLGSCFHRIIKGFMAQGGDFTSADGTGGRSIFGEKFDDENFIHQHDQAGTLSMANSGPNSNGSQFFITFRATPHLDRKHVVFGKVDLSKSENVLLALERVQTVPGDKPVKSVTVYECGVVEKLHVGTHSPSANAVNTEYEQEVIEEDDVHIESSQNEPWTEKSDQQTGPISKEEKVRIRLRQLRQNMKKARQLNNKALREEGETLGDHTQRKSAGNGGSTSTKNADKVSQTSTSKIMQFAKSERVDEHLLTEPASASLDRMYKKTEVDEINQFAVNDYHNPEGQYRNYLRNVKSIPVTAEESVVGPDQLQQRERDGARRLASEMLRRVEKQGKRDRKRTAKEISENKNVSHINQRNKRFNEKINRTYDGQTAEIRDNLERGTAL